MARTLAIILNPPNTLAELDVDTLVTIKLGRLVEMAHLAGYQVHAEETTEYPDHCGDATLALGIAGDEEPDPNVLTTTLKL